MSDDDKRAIKRDFDDQHHAVYGQSAPKEEAEIAILVGYLPQALTDEELRALVDQAVTETGASNARDMGKVMGWLSPRIRGRADGKVASGLVAQALARADLAAHGTEH